MFSGIQEILLVALIVVAIFLVPRMSTPQDRSPRLAPNRRGLFGSRTLRLAIVLSTLWPLAWMLYLRPWQHAADLFLAVGIGPPAVGWSIKWILAGKKKKR